MRLKIIAGVLTLCALICSTCASAESEINLNLSFPYKNKCTYGSPFIDNNNRTQVAIRDVAEGMGYNVDWNPDTQGIKLYKEVNGDGFDKLNFKAIREQGVSITDVVEMHIGDSTYTEYCKYVYKDGTIECKFGDTKDKLIHHMDTQPVVINSRTFIPLRYAVDAMKGSINLNKYTGKILIEKAPVYVYYFKW